VKTLDRYVGRWVLGGTLLALGVLLALVTVFALMDQLDDVGKGHYDLAAMAEYLVLTTPRRAYELIPVAALLGTLLGLGVLASHSELTVIRSAGVSGWRVGGAALKAAAVPILAGVLLGELVAPVADDLAEARRSIAVTSQIALKTRTGFWARDGRSFVNIREVLPDRRLAGVYVYEFDEQRRLRSATRAERARPDGQAWVLEGVTESGISPAGVVRRSADERPWDVSLSSDFVGFAVARADRASSADLARYIRFLRANGQDAAVYELALWVKQIMPFTAAAMVLLGVPFVLGPLRSVGIGQRILAGALVGVAFHIVSQASSQLGLVYGLPTVLGAMAPTGLVLLLAAWLLRRAG
jgi:lipopolysaccharide export system permease protein